MTCKCMLVTHVTVSTTTYTVKILRELNLRRLSVPQSYVGSMQRTYFFLIFSFLRVPTTATAGEQRSAPTPSSITALTCQIARYVFPDLHRPRLRDVGGSLPPSSFLPSGFHQQGPTPVQGSRPRNPSPPFLVPNAVQVFEPGSAASRRVRSAACFPSFVGPLDAGWIPSGPR